MRILICDDDTLMIEQLQRYIESYFKSNHLKCPRLFSFTCGESLLADQEEKDIVFLDISMEKMNGMQTAQQIRAFQSDTSIVFVTAFIEYAPEGYKVGAERYILKDSPDEAVSECMDAILRKRKGSQVQFTFLEGEKKIYIDNLLYVESRKHKVVFFYMEKEIVNYQIYEKLDAVEEKLSGSGFLRIHKSYLVNMKHIRKISNYIATLDTGAELPVPRRKYQSVKEEFVAYKGAL